MQYNTALALALAGAVNAFPGMTMESVEHQNQARDVAPGPAISSGQTNCGPIGGCPAFDYNTQKVSTTGANAYAAPGPSDIRGPCPGLNAAANHGYLPRNGLAHITDTITGLGDLYSMGVGLAGFLAAYAIVFDGDIGSGTWSIGGPPPVQLTNIFGKAEGISYSHNKYEGDTSATRDDAYMNNGDAFTLSIDRFTKGYTYTESGNYNMDSFRQLHQYWITYSQENNPNYFAPLFSTTLVVPAAYNFVINFMSNHSAEEPNGVMTPENYKSFFAITGDYPNFTYNEGQERVPDNFVKRPATKPYTIPDVFKDLAFGWAAYPSSFQFGGNTNGVNTYKGISLTEATGGRFNSLDDLTSGDGALCFFAQFVQEFIPDEIEGLVDDLTSALSMINKYTADAFASCPATTAGTPNSLVGQYKAYPGYNYNPQPA